MLNFSLSCFFHIFIGIILYSSLRGIEKITQKFTNNKIQIFYSFNLVIYFLIAYIIFNINKNFLIFFTILFALYFLSTRRKNLIDLNFLSLLLGILCFSLYIGKIIHGPSTVYSAWGLFDTYFYVSSIYQDSVEIFSVKNNNVNGLSSPILKNIITFLGNQFSSFKKFDGFYFISISLFTFSILNLANEISKLSYLKNKNLFILSISIISLIFALPYPLYFFESPSILLVIPIFPQILIMINYQKNNDKILKYFFIPFAIIISKTAVLSVYFLTLFLSIRKNINYIIKLLFILILVAYTLNLILPIASFFENINVELFEISLNFQGLHKIIHITLIFLVLFFLKKNLFYFIYIPSLIIYIFFHQASPAQLFYLFFFISLLILIYDNKFIKIPSLKVSLFNIIFIFLISLFSFLFGFLIKVDFYLYFIYFFIFLYSFKVVKKKESIFINIVILIFLINSFFNVQFREDNVLNFNQKEIYLKTKELTEKEALIFSDLNLENSQDPPWGLYSSIAERQFYISSFYSDYNNEFNSSLRNKMLQYNDDVINNNIHPKNNFKNRDYDKFYIITHRSNPKNINTDIIFQTQDFKLLKFN